MNRVNLSMGLDISSAVERLRMSDNEHDLDQEERIDNSVGQQRRRKRTRRDIQALKKALEQEILTPQTSFDADWLNKVQQYVVQSRGVRFLLT